MAGEPFGAPVGKMADPADAGLTNDFTNITPRSVEEMLQSTRVQPRDVGTGVMRGTQRIVNTDGSFITLGEIPNSNGEFGIAFFTADEVLVYKSLSNQQAFYDEDGNLISKSTGTTDYKYDVSTGKNYYQNGKLPDGTYGAIFVKDNVDVADVFD